MNSKLSLALVVATALFVSACSSKKEQGPEDTGPTIKDTEKVDYDVFGTGLSMEQLRALGIDGNPMDYKTLYFEYNSSAIDQRSEVIARAHARHLESKRGKNVSLQGHADERGTRDYNLALGERRSKAVADVMRGEGVGKSTLNTISYGEERPVDRSHNEDAWQKNRRVEISY